MLGIEVVWETVFETDMRGFQLWRSTDGERANAVQLTNTLIASRGTAVAGATYQFVDTDVVLGTDYTYWLVQVRATGEAEDIAGTRGRLIYSLYLPVINR